MLDASTGLYVSAMGPGKQPGATESFVWAFGSDGQPAFQPEAPSDGLIGAIYHSLRHLPGFPNWVYGMRVLSGQTSHWAFNLDTGQTLTLAVQGGKLFFPGHSDVSNMTPEGIHMLGQSQRFSSGILMRGLWNTGGNFNPAALGRLERILIHKGTAEWCSFGGADAEFVICPAGRGTGGSAATALPRALRLIFEGNIADPTFPFRPICGSDGAVTGRHEGLPLARWAYDDSSGQRHLLFRGDKTGTPQVYEAVYPVS